MNVCGLHSKLNTLPDSILANDILVFTETKTDKSSDKILTDFFSNHDFKCFFKHRTDLSCTRSGGIIICIKKRLENKCKFLTSKSQFVAWLSIDKDLFSMDKDILLGGVYTPPESSVYSSQFCFADIEQEMTDKNRTNECFVLLMGDFNAHTNNKKEFVDEEDNTVFRFFNFDTHFENKDLNPTSTLDSLDIPKNRRTEDTHPVNNFGRRLLDMCSSNNLYMFNGRLGADRNFGNVTNVKDKTTIDYVIGDIELMPKVSDFKVCDFDPLLSDIHCPVYTSFIMSEAPHSEVYDATVNQPEPAEQKANQQKIVWCKEKVCDVGSLLVNDEDILSLNNLIDSDCSVNDMYKAMKSVIFNTCDKYGMVKQTHQKKNVPKTNVKKNNKPWFDQSCKLSRVKYNRQRNAYLNNKNDDNLFQLMKTACKEYKATTRRAEKRYKKTIINDLKTIKSQDPKKYWSVINKKNQKQVTTPPLTKLENHFESLCKNSIDNELNQAQEKETDKLVEEFTESEEAQTILNTEFSVAELYAAVKKLKNNKAPGIDGIINESICHTFANLKHFWCVLFNKILETGILPEEWQTGVIIPIYKNKGDKNDPNNYRGITLLSCSAKFFTAVLNERLHIFTETLNILSENQAGFRPNHSTTDHMFVLKCMNDLIRSRKKKLFCAFVDYEKAFDKVWHAGLWTKLIRLGIGGKLFNVVRNMYKGIVSCVSSNGISNSFAVHQGVRQGENLSPLLFALYVDDLESHLIQKGCIPVDMGLDFDDRISDYLKILLILYADDTVIFGDSEEKLQKALHELEAYCNEWKLSVNCSKTKIMTFCGRKTTNQYPFTLNGNTLEHVSCFKYLGLTFNFNGKFNVAVKQLKDQARRAMMALLRKSRQLQLPISCQLELFNSLVLPVLTYGCEVWGNSCIDIAESLHLEFCKYILRLKKSTPNCFIYGETGHFPLYIHIYSRMVKFWHRLSVDPGKKYSASMLQTLTECLNFHIHKSDWLCKIKQILDENGLSFVWYFPQSVSTTWLASNLSQRLKDCYSQKWIENCQNCSKANNYALYKTQICFEKYLDSLPLCYSLPMLKLRTSNHKLPVEKGRYVNLQHDERLCTLCDMNRLGDEYHFVMECPALQYLRNQYLPQYYTTHPNFYKYTTLMKMDNRKRLLSFAKFIRQGLKQFS